MGRTDIIALALELIKVGSRVEKIGRKVNFKAKLESLATYLLEFRRRDF